MSLSSTASFYHQLATLLRAGFTLAQALEHCAQTASGWHADQARRWSKGCGTGSSLHEQLTADHESPIAVALIRAGEHSGRLPELCDRIAVIAEHLNRLRSLMIGRLIYPLLLANVALAMPGVPKAVLEGTIASVLIGPAILWTVIAITAVTAVVSTRSGLAARLSLLRGPRFLTLPWVASNTCQVLEAGVAAGMLFHDALELAAPACGNRVMAERLRRAADDLRQGRGSHLAGALRQVGFPTTVVQLVDGGEISGKLEDSLQRAAAFERENFESRSLWAARVVAGICYMAAILGAAYAVFSMYAGYIQQAMEIADDI